MTETLGLDKQPYHGESLSWIEDLTKDTSYPKISDNNMRLILDLSPYNNQLVQTTIHSMRADINLYLWEVSNVNAEDDFAKIVEDLHDYLKFLGNLECLLVEARSNET